MDPEETDGYVNDCLMPGTIRALYVFPNLNGSTLWLPPR